MKTTNHSVQDKTSQIVSKRMIQNIPDLMISMAEVDDDSVQQVRKTAESPPRVSVYDVLGMVTGYARDDRSRLFQRLCEQFPEVLTICQDFRFAGRGQRDTPVTDAEGITQIIMPANLQLTLWYVTCVSTSHSLRLQP
jgi:hypothetical protein